MKKDNSKFWCKFCRIFVYDNKISRANHDKQAAHKSNVERFIRDIEQKKTLELKNTNMAKRLLGIPITQKESYAQSSSVYVPPADLNDDYQNPAFATKYKETTSSVGKVGEWSTVQQEPSTIESNQLQEQEEFNESCKDQDVNDKILEFSRSVLHSTDQVSLNVKESVVESVGEDVTIKKRMFKDDRSKCLKEWNEFKTKCTVEKVTDQKDARYMIRDEQPLMLYHY